MFSENAFNAGASIMLYSCDAASEVKPGLNDKVPKTNLAKAMAIYFKTTTTGFAGGTLGAPSPTEKINPDYKHKPGENVYMIPWSFSRTYSSTGQKTESR